MPAIRRLSLGLPRSLYLDPLTKAMTLILYLHIDILIISVRYDLFLTLLYDNISYEYDSPW